MTATILYHDWRDHDRRRDDDWRRRGWHYDGGRNDGWRYYRGHDHRHWRYVPPYRYSLDFGYRSGYELAWRDWLNHGRYDRYWRRSAFYGYGSRIHVSRRLRSRVARRRALLQPRLPSELLVVRLVRRLVLRLLDLGLRQKTPARLRDRRRAGTQGGVFRKEPAWTSANCVNG